MNQSDISSAAAAIRKRLFLLLLQSFVSVIALILIFVLGALFFLFYRVSNYYPPFRPMLSNVLEAYYQGRGSWEGIQTLIPSGSHDPVSMDQNEWRDSILLDQQGKILIDHGQIDSPRIGQPYFPQPEDTPVPILFQNRQIGTLVVTRLPSGFDALNSLILPLGTMTIFLAILTVIIGLLLSQRLINPLAEVIAASRAVASGNLSARVKVQGPDDLMVLSESFNQMSGTLEKNDREQRNLIADIAHELRTPLAIIQGKLEGVMDGIYPADKAHIQPVLSETVRLEHLINDLDMLAQADSNQLQFNFLHVDLNILCRKSISDFETEASEKKITVLFHPDATIPEVKADPQRISQVMDNLLGNAIRYIPERGEVVVQTRSLEHGAEVTVSDTGPGIADEDLPHIFDRFWRGEKSRSRESGGAGLGLAIARQFIEIQGGKIWAANREDGGLVVGFNLPAVD
ncbi:sensor histidine kinase [Leptolinea tardivitalis]|uniref:sensor histidine kinase n=1 Tax=Leptolinea tardivitalis TaxID=229920 RepID=UPI0007829B81|nr:ATP-binding protein [Leptolinea tardivitalis]GAP21596.1 histidine kinase [Leptolinea tardivitalis]